MLSSLGVTQTTGGPSSGQSQQSQAIESPVPVELKYKYFFLHLAALDQVADKLELAGKDGNTLRGFEARAAGLKPAEEADMKRVALDCNQALEELNGKINDVIVAFQAQHPGKELFHATPPPELAQLQAAKTQIVRAHIDELKTKLGAETFQKLDNYVMQRMKSAVRVVPASGASSGGNSGVSR
jgi:hypothetical protein